MKSRKRKRIIDERTSGEDTARTPAWFVARLIAFAGWRSPRRLHRGIGLDPCAGKHAPATKAARVAYREWRGQDGLALTWRGFRLVFVNPPYGTNVRLWARKAVQEFGFPARLGDDELIMLVAARVDTRWYKLLWQYSTATLKCNRRFTFIGQTDPAKFPQAILYFGKRPRVFQRVFGDLGLVIVNLAPIRTEDDLLRRNVRLYFPSLGDRGRLGDRGDG